jgi:polyisoprenyl-teichoic acid--peptidoglycan teichoic acid transferase
MQNNTTIKPALKSKPPRRKLFTGLMILFVIAAGATAVLTFSIVRDFVITRTTARLPQSPAEQSAAAAAVANFNLPENLGQKGETPLQAKDGPKPKAWDGKSPANILLMGLDLRDWESFDVPRTDTMILVSLNPENRTIGMLSIPRDLWVDIPGFGPNKINTAYRLGVVNNSDGSGPGLAIKTVEKLTGMPIDYYAVIDFNAFEQFIDEIGGIEVKVPHRIVIDPIGDNNTRILKKGVRQLDGAEALAYARNRDTANGDFDRAERQHQVILAIRDKIVNANMLPKLIESAPEIYDDLSKGIHTNLTLMQIVRMAWLAKQIPELNIRDAVISPDQVEYSFSNDGQFILVPHNNAIRELVDQTFKGGPVAPAVTETDPRVLLDAEDAKIMVLNGTLTPGIASETANYLKSLGFVVVEPQNASERYLTSAVIDYTGNPQTVQYLTQLMNIQPENIFQRFDQANQADVVVIVGDDWVTDNPMP